MFYSGKCTGCHYCELACSLSHKGVFSHSDSLIRIITDEKNLTSSSSFCHHCRKPVCVQMCPINAISRNEQTGMVTVDAAKCIGCGLCLECPLGGMSLDRTTGTAVNCDLCNGKPNCVRFCPQGALKYVSLDEVRTARIAPAIADKGAGR